MVLALPAQNRDFGMFAGAAQPLDYINTGWAGARMKGKDQLF
jgi:hypothetical protein